MIQAELEPRFSLSGSQFYRRFSAAKVRLGVSQIWSNVDAVPDSQLNEFRKLPCEQWGDALEEMKSKAPNGKLTAKHVKEIVTRRLQRQESADEQRSLHEANTVENLNDDDDSSENYQPPGNIMEQTNEENFNNDSNFPSSLSSSAYEVTNIVTIQCGNNANPEQQQYSGCWGIIQRLYEQSAFISVGGEVVEYLFTDINKVENPSPVLIEVCDRITTLWQVPNLPASVRHLLATFYQRRLDFSQSDLDVLAAIETCVRPSSATYLAEEKEDDHTNTQNKIKAAGIDHQIASIITPTE